MLITIATVLLFGAQDSQIEPLKVASLVLSSRPVEPEELARLFRIVPQSKMASIVEGTQYGLRKKDESTYFISADLLDTEWINERRELLKVIDDSITDGYAILNSKALTERQVSQLRMAFGSSTGTDQIGTEFKLLVRPSFILDIDSGPYKGVVNMQPSRREEQYQAVEMPPPNPTSTFEPGPSIFLNSSLKPMDWHIYYGPAARTLKWRIESSRAVTKIIEDEVGPELEALSLAYDSMSSKLLGAYGDVREGAVGREIQGEHRRRLLETMQRQLGLASGPAGLKEAELILDRSTVRVRRLGMQMTKVTKTANGRSSGTIPLDIGPDR